LCCICYFSINKLFLFEFHLKEILYILWSDFTNNQTTKIAMKKILFVTAHSYDEHPLEITEEYIEIMSEKSSSIFGEHFHIIPLPNPDKNVLVEWLEVHKPYILHFSGHGNKEGEPILYDRQYIDSESFANIVKYIKSIECIFFSSCQSYEFFKNRYFDVRLLLGFKGNIPIKYATHFSKKFYKSLFTGGSIFGSFTKAFEMNNNLWKNKDYEPMLEVNLKKPITDTKMVDWLTQLPQDYTARVERILQTIDLKGNSLAGRVLVSHSCPTVAKWFMNNKQMLAESIAFEVLAERADNNEIEDLKWDLEVYFKLLDPLIVTMSGKELVKKERVQQVEKSHTDGVYIQAFNELIKISKVKHYDLPEDCEFFEDRVKHFIELIIE
jgi:hypothetical protein